MTAIIKLPRLKRTALFIIAMFVFLIGMIVASVVVSADTFHTVRVNYYFLNGQPAHDPYIATYKMLNDPVSVDLTITNPNINGFIPMVLNDGFTNPSTDLPSHGVKKEKITYSNSNFTEDVEFTVYYVAGLSHYSARYYLQDIYDDLYTLDKTRTEENKDLYWYTGESPTDLERYNIDGFTNLFHEPEAIAADGSTQFRIYYDRNYYSVTFDLGSNGYGVDPIYAKFGTTYRVGEAKRPGYTFKGWARTSADSSKGTLGTDWNYIDENGNTISEATATADANLIQLEGEQTVPAKNTFYKAIWTPTTTSYSVVYWIEKPDSPGINEEYINSHSTTREEAQSIIADHYQVIVAKDIKNVPSGSPVRLTDKIYNEQGDKQVQLKDFFGFNLEEQAKVNGELSYDSDGHPLDIYGKKLDFPLMSTAQRKELTGDKKEYYEFNGSLSALQFKGKDESTHDRDYIEVEGNGTTRINVYFDRVDYKLQFYFAKTVKDGNGDISEVWLTNGTNNYSKSDAGYSSTPEECSLAPRLANANWTKVNGLTEIPQFNPEHADDIGEAHEYVVNSTTSYWYYEIKTRYKANMKHIWFNDAFKPIKRTGKKDIVFGSWAVENGTKYRNDHNRDKDKNYTVKGYFERFSEDLMFLKNYSKNIESKNILHYVASWCNVSGGWNSEVYNFTYKNYVEVLRYEKFLANQKGNSFLITGGDYDAGDQVEKDKDGNPVTVHYQAGHYNGRYIDIIVNNGVIYGLLSENKVETYDAGNRYTSDCGEGKNWANRDEAIRFNQTPVALKGYELIKSDDPNYTIKEIEPGYGDYNPQSYWYAANGYDADHHADVIFFYKLNRYLIKYRNSNQLEEDRIQTAGYNTFLNLEKFQYTPVYPDPELRDFYKFVGWYYDPYHIEPVDFENGRMIDDDITLYAKWAPKTIDVIFYDNYNDFYLDKNRIVLGKDKDNKDITNITIDYGSYVPIKNIPADNSDPENPRPRLEPIAEDADFAGWYYIRNRLPVRFEPENVPVTPVNEESVGENGKLRLFAEWVTKDVAKYKIKYVKQEDTSKEIAAPTTGRAFVWKTKTFSAKSGNQLYDEYKWTAAGSEDGTNWWPTVNSHSLVIKANQQDSEYAPNEFSFEYIQKDKVYYKVQYINAATGEELRPTKETNSTHASVKEDALVVPGYIPRRASESMALTASDKSGESAQMKEELETNVITFLYDENTRQHHYEVEYYTQNVDDDEYSLYLNETLTADKAEGGTSISIQALHNGTIPKSLVANGYTIKANSTKYLVTSLNGTTGEPQSVADDGSVTLTDNDKKTIRIYFDRKIYNYSIKCYDHTQEKAYHDAPAGNKPLWDGLLDQHINVGTGKVGKDISITPHDTFTYTDPTTGEVTNYVRIGEGNVNLTIQPDDNNSGLNLVKIYYRKDTERELEYKMVCVNKNHDTDYEEGSGVPLFGGLSTTLQTVQAYDDISTVTFYNYNEAKKVENGKEKPVHLHRYTFLGWYSKPERGENDEYLITTNEDITKDDLANDEMPAKDSTYYALVSQDMVRMNVEYRYLDGYTKTSLHKLSNDDATPVVRGAPTDGTGDEGDGDAPRVGATVEYSNPSDYKNNTLISWHRNDGYSLSVKPIDNRVYKYEFAEWWEIDGEGKYIRKDNWNSSGEWSPTILSGQLSRQENHHLIAVYTRREVTEMPYTINYRFNTRKDGVKDYVVKGTLRGTDLVEGNENVKITEAGCFELTDDFIRENAPFEKNYRQVLSWDDGTIKKDSVAAQTDGEQDRIITTVVAKQTAQTVHIHYRLTDSGAYSTFDTLIGNNRGDDKKISVLDLSSNANFRYWAIRKTETGPVIAKCYDPDFTFQMLSDYYISPVFTSESTGEKTAKLDPSALATGDEDWLAWTCNNDGSGGTLVIPNKNLTFTGLKDKVVFARVEQGTTTFSNDWSNVWNKTYDLTVFDGEKFVLTEWTGDNNYYMAGSWSESSEGTPNIDTVKITNVDYSRNRWTDENDTVPANGSTDLMFSDYEIAFSSLGNLIKNSSDYELGIVFERCAQLGKGKTFNPDGYDYKSDSDALKNAVSQNTKPKSYIYDGTNTRQIQIKNIATSNLTNKDRGEYCINFKNSHKTVEGEEVYTNKDAIMKVTAYMINKKTNKVTLSNSIYVCLNNIGSINLASAAG